MKNLYKYYISSHEKRLRMDNGRCKFTAVRVRKKLEIRGFTARKGSWILFAENRAVAFSSGWNSGRSAFVYRLQNGKFVGGWTDPYVEDARSIFGEFLAGEEEFEESMERDAEE
jgi:hypothetical protein|nr:MAG TPA: hypothetical protein [Caudoviricetes sp.]